MTLREASAQLSPMHRSRTMRFSFLYPYTKKESTHTTLFPNLDHTTTNSTLQVRRNIMDFLLLFFHFVLIYIAATCLSFLARAPEATERCVERCNIWGKKRKRKKTIFLSREKEKRKEEMKPGVTFVSLPLLLPLCFYTHLLLLPRARKRRKCENDGGGSKELMSNFPNFWSYGISRKYGFTFSKMKRKVSCNKIFTHSVFQLEFFRGRRGKAAEKRIKAWNCEVNFIFHLFLFNPSLSPYCTAKWISGLYCLPSPTSQAGPVLISFYEEEISWEWGKRRSLPHLPSTEDN